MSAPTRGYKLGRLKNDPSKPRLALYEAPATYTPPPAVDYYSRVPAADWGMDGNDNVGDCTCADVDHEVKSDQVVAGNPIVTSTASEVLAAYSAITGYTPTDPSTDRGAQMQDVRNYWRKTGFTLGGKTDRIVMFAELNIANTTLIKWALDRLGSIGFGINFPNSAMDQFDAGQPWDVVPGEPDPTEGHAIAVVGYDGTYWYVLTWSRVQRMTTAFYAKYVEEAWLALSQDFVNTSSGTDEFGETLYQLGQQFASITNQPNPIPAPTPGPAPVPPSPAPTPAPAPAPSPAEADQTFIRTATLCTRISRPYKTWKKARGYAARKPEHEAR